MNLTDHKTGVEGKRKRKQSTDLSSLIYGKIPPQAKDLEEAILGAIMLEKNAIDSVIEWLTPERFYVDAHQRIFKAMIRLHQRSFPIDILTVAEELKKSEELDMVGGPYYVTKLTNAVVSSAHAEHHSKIILQKHIQREVIRVGGEMIGDAYEDSVEVFDLIDKVENDIFQVTSQLHKRNYLPIDTLLVQSLQELEKKRHTPDRLSGVPSGFPSIDKLTHGWQPTDLIVLAARPSVGKTALALNFAINAALDPNFPVPVAFFSLEMSAKQLVNRIMACESEIHLEKIQRGRMEEEDMKQLYSRAIQRLSKSKIFIDDTPGLNIFELKSKCRRMKNKDGIGLIIIDYLQLMSGTGNERQNREQEISTISRNLKGLAKDLEVPIIALSQLSRETEKRSNKQPQLSDLRESGAIEQDADVVGFIYRPEYYGEVRDEMGQSNPGETQVRFAKHRSGSLGTIKLQAKLWIQRFTEYNTLHLPSNSVPGNNRGATTEVAEEIDDLPF